ncbi:hypothetical protein BO82DRAFT_381126 [Aspergillus uvarum CBS 121591]|uniref:Class I glutamine amidotransferase-like protein n=1 Tax=Aspergillus uvarum CBS 121591 TaxID=1448315 RepID=A0A319CM65_9EURO|nr:hypothetical protein BO82DRAFT_381126 [Aspergillus uvarum CBS 121591]PYH85111.1 hypothetical protein BO82DRAFT_381126 [Aspergillus uvarum CBS 121591]
MPPKKHIHIALLDTDLPVPTIYAHRGLYSTQFRHLLRAAAATINPAYELHTTAFDVVGGHLPAYTSLQKPAASPSTPQATSDAASEERLNPLSIPITGILITGSSASAYDPTKPWIPPLTTFLQTVHAQYPSVRLFGSCFGHQILARALLELDPEGQQPYWNIQMIHGDHVRICRPLPAAWCVIGASAECAVQGLYHPAKVLTYQGHFEFDAEVNRETCLEFGRRQGWDAGDVERWVEAIGADDEGSDAVGAAGVVVRFFAGEDEDGNNQRKHYVKVM